MTHGPYCAGKNCHNKKFASPWLTATESFPNLAEGKSERQLPEFIQSKSEFPSMYKLKRDTKDEELDLLWRPIKVDSETSDISILQQKYKYPKFPNNSKSLLSKHCTKEVFKQL